jgi:hypothetical protein
MNEDEDIFLLDDQVSLLTPPTLPERECRELARVPFLQVKSKRKAECDRLIDDPHNLSIAHVIFQHGLLGPRTKFTTISQ